MNDHDDREERAIQAALDWLEGGDAEVAPEGSEADATLRRLTVETLGLLPWALEPETPSAGARDRLLAALPARAEGSEEADDNVRSIESARQAAVPAPPATPEASQVTRRGWPTSIAAALLIAALGLAGVAGWLGLQLGEARDSLAQARGALAGAEVRRSELSERLESQEAQLRRSAGMESFLAAASTPGVEICPLRPVGDPALHPEAFGMLYMPPGSGKWYLVASNLAPGDRGTYTVWLDTPDGPVSVGRLEAGSDSALEFQLPPDVDARHELMLSIFVTLEPEPESSTPNGPQVLFGDEKLQVL